MNALKFMLLIPLIYLALAAIYQLVLAIASKKYKALPLKATKGFKTKVLMPAYREDQVILSSAAKNLEVLQNYPDWELTVIADGLKEETKRALGHMGAHVLPVSFDKSTKVKALNKALEQMKEEKGFELLVILDADNVIHPDFVLQSESYASEGYRVIQGERLASNSTNSMEILDGLSEKANQEMLCKGANQLGLSSKLTGSAMVLDYTLAQEYIPKLKAVGGFDKELELLLTAHGEYIKYAPEIAVWDEKVGNREAFAKQRGRWLESQYTFLKKSFGPAFLASLSGNEDYFHKSLQLALPPRVLAPVLLLFGGLLSWAFGALVWSSLYFISFGILILSYLIVLPLRLWKSHFWLLFAALPGLVWAAFKSLTWMKKSRTQFLHTKHQPIQS